MQLKFNYTRNALHFSTPAIVTVPKVKGSPAPPDRHPRAGDVRHGLTTVWRYNNACEIRVNARQTRAEDVRVSSTNPRIKIKSHDTNDYINFENCTAHDVRTRSTRIRVEICITYRPSIPPNQLFTAVSYPARDRCDRVTAQVFGHCAVCSGTEWEPNAGRETVETYPGHSHRLQIKSPKKCFFAPLEFGIRLKYKLKNVAFRLYH